MSEREDHVSSGRNRAWERGLLAILLMLAATSLSVLVLTTLPVFDRYYPWLGPAGFEADASSVMAWLHTSDPPPALLRTFTQGAIGQREIDHFLDVRALFSKLPVISLSAWFALALAFALSPNRWALARSISILALALIAILFAAAIAMALWDWKFFFALVHQPFFEGESWKLPKRCYTLTMFPNVFWKRVAILAGSTTLLQLGMLFTLASVICCRTSKNRDIASGSAEEPRLSP